MAVSVTIRGNLVVRRKLQLASTAIRLGAMNGLVRAGLHLQGEVKESIAGRKAEATSVDTGRLLNSVDLLLRKFEAVIFSDVPYAGNIEFNPSIFRGPRKHFHNSLSRNRATIRRFINEGVSSVRI